MPLTTGTHIGAAWVHVNSDSFTSKCHNFDQASWQSWWSVKAVTPLSGYKSWRIVDQHKHVYLLPITSQLLYVVWRYCVSCFQCRYVCPGHTSSTMRIKLQSTMSPIAAFTQAYIDKMSCVGRRAKHLDPALLSYSFGSLDRVDYYCWSNKPMIPGQPAADHVACSILDKTAHGMPVTVAIVTRQAHGSER